VTVRSDTGEGTPDLSMMSIPASSEFMALCRSQLRLLTEGLGASLSIVYMTEEVEGTGESKLLPVVVYPDSGVERSHSVEVVTSELILETDKLVSLSPNYAHTKQLASNEDRQMAILANSPTDLLRVPMRIGSSSTEENREPGKWEELDYQNQRLQVLLPLMYDGTILGVLVTRRESQPWGAEDQTEIQHVAQTIAIAGTLDKRRNWLTAELQRQQEIQLHQRDLLHNLLHQLRNPLMAIRTFGKLLIRRLQPGDPNQTVATSIVRESDRLQELLQYLETTIDITIVEDPLDRASLQSATAKPTTNSAASENLLLPESNWEIESCHLMEILTPIIITAEAIAQDRNLNFHTHIAADLPPIRATPSALREVLSNLIDNALKYTPTGGFVDIDVELLANPPRIQICIRDTGLGIPAEDLDKLFTRHYRGIQAQGTIEGTGLGLAIAKELIDRMQGKIVIASPPPGIDRGTEFTLWLLLAS
jgi:signal transduction histidine kinase